MPAMNQLTAIRERLGKKQAQLAAMLGISQSTWAKYEKGREIPAEIAKKLILQARIHGLLIDMNHIFDDVPLPPEARPPVEAQPTAPPPQPLVIRRRGVA